ncbi:hypothetical protein PBY51_019940 [Eleginops maclovinus]|uniref:Uncharacterized protein n=1 Tax=Eleginops maclovinus TaxID=56733 RepID=A0AAN8AK72_ELEMC|nr:hypothetical protein PBY51_019940 [Eleginops maclovinus]
MVPYFPLLRCQTVFQNNFGADRKSFSMASPNFSPKHVVRMNWERLEESQVEEAFNSHLRRSFSGIPVEAGDIEPEWAVFKASIAEAAAGSFGLKVLGASRGGNLEPPGGHWWSGKPSD